MFDNVETMCFKFVKHSGFKVPMLKHGSYTMCRAHNITPKNATTFFLITLNAMLVTVMRFPSLLTSYKVSGLGNIGGKVAIRVKGNRDYMSTSLNPFDVYADKCSLKLLNNIVGVCIFFILILVQFTIQTGVE